MSVPARTKQRQIVSSIPILDIPLWGEKERLPVLINNVNELNRIARAVLVLSILPWTGGSV